MAPKDESPVDAQIKALVSLVETLIVNQNVTSNEGLTATLAGLMERLGEQNANSVALMSQMQKNAARPSNNIAHMRSVFNLRGETLEGYTKPVLCCEMMVPWRVENESSTREEVELFNLVAQAPGNYVIRRVDDSRIKLSVVREMDESETKAVKVTFKHDTAFRNEYKGTMPPMWSILRQILSQASEDLRKQASLVLTMDEEAALIEAGKLTVAA